MDCAPVTLFVYNRPAHTRKTLHSLMANKYAAQSDLYIYADGAKPGASEVDIANIEETRRVIREEKWCKSVNIIESKTNRGLAASIIKGVSEVVRLHERIIVLEDDLVTGPYFLSFMNEALELYKFNDEVACISGYVYPVKKKLPDTFFIKGADCWGWATWSRAWNIFEPDGKKLLQELEQRSLESKFDFENSYPYIQMLKDQINQVNNSWAIRWYASAFVANKLCLYPGRSLVQNIGIDGSGTHSGSSDKWEVKLFTQKTPVKQIPLVESCIGKQAFIHYFRNLNKHRTTFSLRTFIKRIINKVGTLKNIY